MLLAASNASRAQQPTAARPAAVVNGEPIAMAELEEALKQAPLAVEMPEQARINMRRHALAMLIDDTLMQQFLKANAPEVTKAEVDQRLAEMDAALKQEKKTIESFCKENGQTVQELREGLHWMLRWSAWAKTHIADADVQRYYQEYKDLFDGVSVRVSHVALRLPENAGNAERAKAKAQLTGLRAQILAKKMDFATAAKTYSQCDSNKSGGDLGYIGRKTLDEPFSRVAFSLQPGQVSEVVQTDFGMHLILVTERKPGQPSDFAMIKEQVREIYTEEVRLTILAQQRRVAKLEVNIP
jgi:peptidyl-prolyl cis-trans isomerase C